MSIELTEFELETARRIAGARRAYAEYVEVQDVENELVAWMLEREDKVREWREGDGFKALHRSLARAAKHFCEQQKGAVVGYSADDQAGYSSALLRKVLPEAMAGDWFDGNGMDEPHNMAAVHLIDARRALEQIDQNSRDILESAVLFDWDYGSIADFYGVTYQTVWKRVQRSLRRLVDAANGALGERAPYADVPRYSNAEILRQQDRWN